jgi:hypothetical protein
MSLLEFDAKKRLYVRDVVNNKWFDGISLFGDQEFDFKSLLDIKEVDVVMAGCEEEEEKETR